MPLAVVLLPQAVEEAPVADVFIPQADDASLLPSVTLTDAFVAGAPHAAGCPTPARHAPRSTVHSTRDARLPLQWLFVSSDTTTKHWWILLKMVL